jgi:hypothetical protein
MWKNQIRQKIELQNCTGDCDDPIDGKDISKCIDGKLGGNYKYVILDS